MSSASTASDLSAVVSSLLQLVRQTIEAEQVAFDINLLDERSTTANGETKLSFESLVHGLRQQQRSLERDVKDTEKSVVRGLERVLERLRPPAPREPASTGGASSRQVEDLRSLVERTRDEQRRQLQEIDKVQDDFRRFRDHQKRQDEQIRQLGNRVDDLSRRSPRAQSVAPPPSAPAATPSISESSGAHSSCAKDIKELWTCTKERLATTVMPRIEKLELKAEAGERVTSDAISGVRRDNEYAILKFQNEIRMAQSDATSGLKKLRELDESVMRLQARVKALEEADDLGAGGGFDLEDGEVAMMQD